MQPAFEIKKYIEMPNFHESIGIKRSSLEKMKMQTPEVENMQHENSQTDDIQHENEYENIPSENENTHNSENSPSPKKRISFSSQNQSVSFDKNLPPKSLKNLDFSTI